MTTGMDLKVRRVAAGIKQRDLAARIGVTRQTLTRWEGLPIVRSEDAQRYMAAVQTVRDVYAGGKEAH